MSENKFTWIKFFQEVHKKIHNDYNSKDLANIANKIFGHIKDIDIDGKEISIEEMTPINFIGYFNRKLTYNNKLQACTKLKDLMKLTSNVPIDFNGIPEFNNQNCLCMSFKKDRANYIINEQWEISKQILNNNINSKLFDKILSKSHPHIGISYLSRFCFIVNPDIYYPCDDKMSSNLGLDLPKTYEDYIKYCKLLKSKYPDKTSYELSYEAFEGNINQKNLNNKMTSNTQKTILPNTKKFPKNQILYGPPGTGKTYSIKEDYIQNILGSNPGLNVNSEEQKLNDIVKNLSWYTAIALSMYLNGKQNKYKVSDLMQQKIIKLFALTRENKNMRAALWAQMQIHTSVDCKTVNYTNRQAPFIFEKNENSEWYLTEEGIKFVEENLADQIEQYNAPDNTRKIEDFYKFITFHQSYSYEEFVEGIKPRIDVDDETSIISYEYNRGIFKEICQQANSDPDNNYLLIIDEINRGNISKIFGELITLIEADKRVIPNKERNFENTKVEKEQLLVTLPYTKSKFGVPNNLYILGTMNTSDRSIASIDIALRRRFKFIEMMPKSELVADFGCGFQTIFEKLNTKIKILLDRDHQIGHSYFINTKYANADVNTLKEIWFSEIIPLLNEYFYCDWEKLKLVIPGFIKEINIPEELKNECEDSMYEFKTPNEVKDFVGVLKQDKFKQEN